MHTIRRQLSTFSNLLDNIYESNVVIGGTNALLIHGLVMSRQPGDLDLVIFNPTEKQKTVLKYMKPLCDAGESGYNGADELRKSYKFTINDMVINILIENTNVSSDLLIFKFDGRDYKVQSIKEVIDAKRSYHIKNKNPDNLIHYVRDKDVRDFIDLKNSNFNL